MPLLALWRSAPETVANLNLQQVVSNAGDGELRDGSLCSVELRAFLRETPTAKLATYIGQCLTQTLPKGGLILQDLVNELGRRLDYDVEDGRYSGISGQIGFDGIWATKGKPALIVEVKTTDAYRLSLDTLVGYRTKLVDAGKCGSDTSILIVVGRQDTGELEAQIRGSRHAWEIRLISAEALLRLVDVKEGSEQEAVDEQIRDLLRPAEYTRLDALVDVVFSASKDREQAVVNDVPDQAVGPSIEPAARKHNQAESPAEMAAKRERIVAAWSKRVGAPLLAKSRALFWSADHGRRAGCTISKRYPTPAGRPYWYAYHPAWREFLPRSKMGTS